MPSNLADPQETAHIRRLALDPTRVQITQTATYDLMGRDLTKVDICNEIVTWIDSGAALKKVKLRGRNAGQTALEFKPRIDGQLYYVKLTLCELEQSDEYMLIISAHLDH